MTYGKKVVNLKFSFISYRSLKNGCQHKRAHEQGCRPKRSLLANLAGVPVIFFVFEMEVISSSTSSTEDAKVFANMKGVNQKLC